MQPHKAMAMLLGALLLLLLSGYGQAYLRPSPLFGPKGGNGPRRGVSAPLPPLPHASGAFAPAPLRSTFSSFFAERTGANASATSGANLAYEMRLLELEGRLLKMEGQLARAGKNVGGGGGNGGMKGTQGGNVKGATGSTTSAFNHILPDGEQLLLGCTFAGAVVGLLVGRALLSKQMYLGGVGGAVLGVHFFNKDGNFGSCIRAMGKLVLYACDRLAYAWSELKFNWKAWRVYERSFKKLESLDKEMQVTKKIKAFDQQYQVSSNVNVWWKKFQSSAKNMEENLKEQAVYWQRAQRLREEQRQAQLIQQEIQRQQERERLRQNGNGVSGGFQAATAGGDGFGGGGGSAGGGNGGGQQAGGFHAVVGDEGSIQSLLRSQQQQQPPTRLQQQEDDSSMPTVETRPPSYAPRASSSSSLDEGGNGPTIASEFNRFVKNLGGTTSKRTGSSSVNNKKQEPFDPFASPSAGGNISSSSSSSSREGNGEQEGGSGGSGGSVFM